MFNRRSLDLNQALHAKLGEKEAECRHAQELLATARSSASAAERRGEEWKHELETAKVGDRDGWSPLANDHVFHFSADVARSLYS